jgi:hypothetical protein
LFIRISRNGVLSSLPWSLSHSSRAGREIAVYENSGRVYEAASGVIGCEVSKERSSLIFARPFKMMTLRSFEMSENEYSVTQRHVPDERNPQLHRCENLKTRTAIYIYCCKVYVYGKSIRIRIRRKYTYIYIRILFPWRSCP